MFVRMQGSKVENNIEAIIILPILIPVGPQFSPLFVLHPEQKKKGNFFGIISEI